MRVSKTGRERERGEKRGGRERDIRWGRGGNGRTCYIVYISLKKKTI